MRLLNLLNFWLQRRKLEDLKVQEMRMQQMSTVEDATKIDVPGDKEEKVDDEEEKAEKKKKKFKFGKKKKEKEDEEGLDEEEKAKRKRLQLPPVSMIKLVSMKFPTTLLHLFQKGHFNEEWHFFLALH